MRTNIEKLTDIQKHQIMQRVEAEIVRLGSQAAVAKKCSVSDAAIDQIRKGKYSAKGNLMWLKIAKALNWKNEAWTVVTDTLDIRTVLKVLNDAKRKSMFMAISNRAGSGKSAACDIYMSENKQNVFYIECGQWNQRQFLNKLCRVLGVDPSPGYPASWLMEKVIDFFTRREGRPILIIDQANSMKPSVLSFLIFLFNECEDRMAMVVIGTPHLEKMIKTGVRRDFRYYDEIDSRLGRTYIKLTGCTLADARKICAANGIADKLQQENIWRECEPIDKIIEVDHDGNKVEKKIKVVEDMRRLKRVIQREQLKIEDSN